MSAHLFELPKEPATREELYLHVISSQLATLNQRLETVEQVMLKATAQADEAKARGGDLKESGCPATPRFGKRKGR